MAKYSVSYIYEIVDKYSATINKIKRNTKEAGRIARITGEKFSAMGKKMMSVGKGLTLKLATPILAIGIASLKSAADFETLRVSFDTMLGSAEKGKKLFSDLVKFSTATPFQLGDNGSATTQSMTRSFYNLQNAVYQLLPF